MGPKLEKTDPEIANQHINFLGLTKCNYQIICNGKLSLFGRKSLKSPLERMNIDGWSSHKVKLAIQHS